MPHTEKPVLRLVVYYRASSLAGEVPGLNLDKQRTAVAAFGWFRRSEIVREFTELEDGETETRPQLILALSEAHRLGADLLIASMSSQTQNPAFLSLLVHAENNQGVKALACGIGDGDYLPTRFLLDAASYGARSHSESTIAGLQAAKARGVVLGMKGIDNLSMANDVRSALAETKRKRHLSIILRIRKSGVSTLQGIADALIAQGIKTPRGNTHWTPTQVRRVMGVVRKGNCADSDGAASSEKPTNGASSTKPEVFH